MNRALLVVLLAACGCAVSRAQVAKEQAQAINSYGQRLEQIREELGAARIAGPPSEDYHHAEGEEAGGERDVLAPGQAWRGEVPTGKRVKAEPIPNVDANVAVERGDNGEITRVGWMAYAGSGCDASAQDPAPEVLFAKAGDKLRVIVVVPDVTIRARRVKGRCGGRGCGATPPPPWLQITWLPVTSPAQIVVERRTIPFTRVIETCNNPYPPPP